MQIFKDILDERCRRHWWRLWSNQFAVVIAAAATWAVENQHVVLGWVNQIEQPYRSVLTFIVVAGIPIALRSIRQPKLADQAEGG